jgi:hypothetical protein
VILKFLSLLFPSLVYDSDSDAFSSVVDSVDSRVNKKLARNLGTNGNTTETVNTFSVS